MAPVLNLNNEVVKMRKDVKKARVLTIRRLTRHIGKLKSKKGSEDLKLKNQKRVERLIEEIHAMKEIKPDEVSRLALRTEVNFESVCKKPNCTAAERAMARLATHPTLKPRFVELKAAVKAFKDARKNPDKATPVKKDQSEEQPKSAQHSNSNLDDQASKQPQKQQRCEHEIKSGTKIKTDKVEELCERESEQNTVEMERAYTPEEPLFLAVEMQTVTQNKTGKKLDYQKKKENMSMNKLNTIKEITDDSDQEQPHEKEYFDDSTEERFYNESSDSDSDSNDDFFIGKVKKKKKVAVNNFSSTKGKGSVQKNVIKTEKSTVSRTAQNLIMEERKPLGKTNQLESVFCSSLSTTNQKSQNRRNTKDEPLKNERIGFLKNETKLKKKPLAKASGGTNSNSKKAHLEQPLHPSWEASRRRREQMSQITAFQGKRIKFDD
ncbi:serum response factor-binding protein 1 [Sylvia atricapilla]|uniref:serum response factor-binding protein 1 n=1 Tax=Sylvia atricapilla TaxID=48155 RepID=UPI003391B3BE